MDDNVAEAYRVIDTLINLGSKQRSILQTRVINRTLRATLVVSSASAS